MKVCVIGAGPSGLTTIKQLLDEGHEVTAFEKNEDIGGIWYRHDGDGDETKAFDNLILSISAKLMSFSDFMVRDRVFYTRTQYREYLEAYAERFGLRRHIQFRASVNEIRKTPSGEFRVTVSREGSCAEHEFGAVAICSGPFEIPNLEVEGLRRFRGDVVHSSRYRNNAPFRGKRVLVVGLAESGADVVREISDVASECTLALRSYPFLLPRLISGRHATDSGTTRAHHYQGYVRMSGTPYPMTPLFGDHPASKLLFRSCSNLYGLAAVAKNAISNWLRPAATDLPGALNALGEPMFPLKADLGTEYNEEVAEAVLEWNSRSDDWSKPHAPRIIFAKNISFVPNILAGKIDINDSGIADMDGFRVRFADGSSKEFDAVVLCTGFFKDFTRFGADVSVPENNVRNLYKHAFHPDHGGRVAHIGFVRPFSGGIPICAEMQARYFARLCSGALSLPSDVRERIRVEKEWEDAATARSPRHTEAIPSQTLFLDAMASEIGCLMPLSQLLRQPRLLVRHWFYTYNQASYRLVGPHNMAQAALDEMMSEKPGPVGSNVFMSLLMAVSMVPYSVFCKVFPEGVDSVFWLPGQPRPAPSPPKEQRRKHPLRSETRRAIHGASVGNVGVAARPVDHAGP